MKTELMHNNVLNNSKNNNTKTNSGKNGKKKGKILKRKKGRNEGLDTETNGSEVIFQI